MKQVQGGAPSLEGRRALVIGGSGGIGRAVSIGLASRGAYVVVHGGSSRERLDSTLAELENLGAGAEGFLMNLGVPEAGLARLADALPLVGEIDLLVVAFGPFVQKRIGDTSFADWEHLALLGLALPGALCSAVLPSMQARGWGRILLFGGSRTDGIRAYSSNAAYAAAKTGLAVLAKSVAAEGAAKGVGCVLVCPGLVDTEYLTEPEKAALRAIAPSGRLASTREIAETALALTLAEPCLASGAIVSLDGGLSF